jgi:hypothetical protein
MPDLNFEPLEKAIDQLKSGFNQSHADIRTTIFSWTALSNGSNTPWTSPGK